MEKRKKNITMCANCMQPEFGSQKLMLCSRCRTAYYCSTECQKSDWPKHKEFCKKRSYHELMFEVAGKISKDEKMINKINETASTFFDRKKEHALLFLHIKVDKNLISDDLDFFLEDPSLVLSNKDNRIYPLEHHAHAYYASEKIVNNIIFDTEDFLILIVGFDFGVGEDIALFMQVIPAIITVDWNAFIYYIHWDCKDPTCCFLDDQKEQGFKFSNSLKIKLLLCNNLKNKHVYHLEKDKKKCTHFRLIDDREK